MFSVLLHPKANRFLEGIDKTLRDRIKEKLRTLAEDPEKGEKLRHSHFWKLRIGDYRAIYEIDYENRKVIILFIGHRREVYDDFSRLL